MRGLIYCISIIYITISAPTLSVGNGVGDAKNNSENELKEDIPKLAYSSEKHFRSLTQLTFGGDNAEAYFNSDGSMLVFQATNSKWGSECDQIYIMRSEGVGSPDKRPALISYEGGRTTCSYFLPGDSTVVYASTHLNSTECPPVPERRTDGKYLWPVYSSFDIFVSDLEGNIINQLTNEPGYDAEATVSPKGDKIVFTSTRSGDLELYTMDIDGGNVKQITSELGYDGGAFFSPDGSKLVFRSSRPTTKDEIKEYKTLLKDGLVAPTNMEIYVCNVDGSELNKVTSLGNANWAPFFHPSGEKIIFSSNHMSEKGMPFNLFLINVDGSGLEQITFDGFFDAFPMFSPDGKKLIFSSNRNNGGTRDTNLFIADWRD